MLNLIMINAVILHHLDGDLYQFLLSKNLLDRETGFLRSQTFFGNKLFRFLFGSTLQLAPLGCD